MANVLTFVQGDTKPDLMAIIHKLDDPTTPLDLTDCSVRFQMRRPDDRRFTVNAAASVYGDPETGQVMYSWQGNDLSVPGEYVGQWEITFLGGAVQTTAYEVPIVIRRK